MPNSLYKSISLWIIKILLFTVPFIPLVIAKSMFFPFITPKAFLFRIVVEISFALWAFLTIFYKEYRPRLNSLTIAIGAFLIIVSLATIFGVNPAKSFWSNFERMEGLITYLHLGAYFLVLAHVFEKKDWFLFFNLFVISGLIENFYVLFQKLGYLASPQGGVRVDGTIGNSTYLAAHLIFVLGFNAILLMHAKSRAGKIFYGLAAAFTLMSIYFTATRGAMLALLLGGFIFSVIYLALIKTDTEKGKKHRKIGLYILGTLVAIPILFAIFRNTEFVSSSPVLGRFRNLSLDDARAYIWQMSFQGFKERPILGWGPENYGLVFSKYYRPELYAQEPWFDRAHNIVLDWLVNAGVPGLLSYLGIFVAAFYLLWLNWQKKKVTLEVGITLAILLVVYFLQNLFVFDNIATYISFFAILAYIYNMTVFEDPLANESGSSSGSRHSAYKPAIDIAYAPLAGVFLALPLFYTLYAGNWKPYAANIALLNGIKVRTIQEVDAGYDEFKKALEYNTLGNQEIREQYAKFAEIVVMTEGIPDAKKLEIFKMALQEIDKSIQENPLDSRPLLFFSALLIRANLPDQALAALNKALELSPQKQQVYFEIGDLYLKRADYPKAIEILEKAWKLEPKFRKALVNYLAALILGGENAKADTLITETWPTELDPEPLLLQVYQKVGDHRRLLPWLDVFVKSFPDNWTYRQDRAIALISLGRRAEAIRFIEDSIKQYPQFKSEGENFLRQIR